MLTCRDVSNLASDYVNRDLPLRRRLAVRFHLLMCTGCTRYIKQMRAAVAVLRRMGGDSTGTAASPDTPAPSVNEDARALFRSARRH